MQMRHNLTKIRLKMFRQKAASGQTAAAAEDTEGHHQEFGLCFMRIIKLLTETRLKTFILQRKSAADLSEISCCSNDDTKIPDKVLVLFNTKTTQDTSVLHSGTF